ncbi:agmatine deiminase family protein [Tautonia plasticadhaerens]|uniref:Agmatine deiminase n=1 Tax=Tautonia plasticadhaerens TaxID=2527974 RepID=A0A518H9P8_9BACT|nr:agmatine deiminase family protein [Tautonia plasticadhaerens]QDV37571.1 Agmatine deiminase [Tautonia plasticadhaerens]
MISDDQADEVYISDLLEGRHPSLVERLRSILVDHGVPLGVIGGTRDIWCRDYMPIQVGPGEFVRFRYAPDYLRGYEHLITAPGDIGTIAEIRTLVRSEIVLDGGNVVNWGNRCIVTDKVFRENPGISRDTLIGSLRDLLRVEDLIVIPNEPYDVVGHADGVVRFLDEGTVVVNDYGAVAPWYGRRLRSALRGAGLDWVELPYRPEESSGGDLPSAVGCYANFLMVRGLIVVPSYGDGNDDRACRVFEENKDGVAVVPLGCRSLAREGGVLNCVTWTIAECRNRIASCPHEENHQR